MEHTYKHVQYKPGKLGADKGRGNFRLCTANASTIVAMLRPFQRKGRFVSAVASLSPLGLQEARDAM